MVSETAMPTLVDGFLAEPETFYRTILESLCEGVIITDAQWRVHYANQMVTEITGYPPEELYGRSVHEVLSPDGRVPNNGACSKGPLSDQAQVIEVELRRKDGRLHWVQIKTTPYRNSHGEIVGTVAALSGLERQKNLEWENERLQDEIRLNFGNFIGQSPALQKVMSQIAIVAPTDANVLILGESGTGKELVARAIHDLSGRKDRALVRVNCPSIPKDLFESEFFGHVRGAFTGALKDRIGRFELADGGTLFLDEIGEIPLDLQSKLLRVLQEGQFDRLGEDRTRTVNVRVIAATNRDLLAEARSGRFRLDLYYRLSVFPIELPPLRERPEDVGLLAEHFIEQSARRLGVPRPRLGAFQERELQNYDWPGNVRELQNVIERAVILARGGRLKFALFARNPEKPAASAPDSAAEQSEPTLDDLVLREREIVLRALRRANWKIYGPEAAAARLKVKPTTLVSMMKRLKIEKPKS